MHRNERRLPGFGLGLGLGIALGLGGVALAQGVATVNTNGILKGYIVQQAGKEICRDPSVWVKFRGPDSYIICD